MPPKIKEPSEQPARSFLNRLGAGRSTHRREAADFLRVSQSWLAKARMRGDGPPYVKLGRSIRYRGEALCSSG